MSHAAELDMKSCWGDTEIFLKLNGRLKSPLLYKGTSEMPGLGVTEGLRASTKV